MKKRKKRGDLSPSPIFTLLMERKDHWIYIAAILQGPAALPGIRALKEKIAIHGERFEWVEDIPRAQLDEWLRTEHFARLMDISRCGCRGHQLGYFASLDAKWVREDCIISENKVLLHVLDQSLPMDPQ